LDFALTPGQRELRARAAAFVDEVLIPLELTAELAGGRLPEADRSHVRDQARERGLDSGNHAVELGGRGWDNVGRCWCRRSRPQHQCDLVEHGGRLQRAVQRDA
jgi:alkylation response protein AidB-like acyl-CoA dehydrogenase